jgi:hypothetical protein
VTRLPSVIRRPLVALAVLASCVGAGNAVAAGPVGPDGPLRSEMETVQSAYRNAWESCRKLSGHARAVCKVQARSDYDVARAESRARAQPTARNQDKLATEKAQAAYRLALAKCLDLRGGAREVCSKDARASYEAARSQARLTRPGADKGLNLGRS